MSAIVAIGVVVLVTVHAVKIAYERIRDHYRGWHFDFDREEKEPVRLRDLCPQAGGAFYGAGEKVLYLTPSEQKEFKRKNRHLVF